MDIGILRWLSGQQGAGGGEIYETMVVNELYKWIKTTQRDADLCFYRTRSGREMDILLETTNGIIGMEIKARASARLSDARGLSDIAAALKEQWLAGLIVYRGDEIKKIADPNIWAVPSHRLLA